MEADAAGPGAGGCGGTGGARASAASPVEVDAVGPDGEGGACRRRIEAETEARVRRQRWE